MNTTEPFERSKSSMVAFSSAARSPAGAMVRGSATIAGALRCSSHGRSCQTATPPISAATSEPEAPSSEEDGYASRARYHPAMHDPIDIAFGVAVLVAALIAGRAMR